MLYWAVEALRMIGIQGRPMRVLFLSHLVPYPLDTGAKIRAYYVLRQLAGAGHEVVLCAFSRPEDQVDPLVRLGSLCSEIHLLPIRRSWQRNLASGLRSGVTGTSFIMDRDWMKEMQSLVISLMAKEPGFDIVHADQLAMAPYAVAAKKRYQGKRPPAILLDQHNAVYKVFRRLASSETRPLLRLFAGWEARRLARQEVHLCAEFDHVVWVAEHDKKAVQTLLGPKSPTRNTPCTMIPIGVDPVAESIVARCSDPHRVLFIGPLNWPPNLQGVHGFLQRMWPQIHAQAPKACFTVIGRKPPSWLLDESQNREDLEVAGHVADLTPYLKEAAALVAPLEAGGGLRVKILNAWCWGIPVVSTSVGAEGLPAQDRKNLILADTDESFVAAVVGLFRDSTVGRALAWRGRETVETHYDWRVLYPAWNRVYSSLQEGRRTAE